MINIGFGLLPEMTTTMLMVMVLLAVTHKAIGAMPTKVVMT
jgi:hypothetical protein